MSALAHFLVANGVVRAVVNFATVTLLGTLVALARTHLKRQRQTVDLLRTDTPGGNAEIMREIQTLRGEVARLRAQHGHAAE